MEIPSSYYDRQPPAPETGEVYVQDSAPPDFDDSIEFVSHNSGKYGNLSKAAQREAFATLGNTADSNADCNPNEIIENLACIYKYTYPNLVQKKDIEQIGVGIVLKVHGDACGEDATVDIHFCPPAGSKAQTLRRPDTLYQNISASMAFNLKYRLKKKGSAVFEPDVEKKQPRSVLLAWNLDVTREGKFSNMPCIGSEAAGASSLQFANQVITSFYSKQICRDL